MTSMYNRNRRQRVNDWLDRAATADTVIGYTLVAILVLCLGVLLIEALPAIGQTILAWVTR